MKYAYVTVLSTENYYQGVVGLFESLKNTNPKYKEFVVLVNETISNKINIKLLNRGYKVMVTPRIEFSNNREYESYPYWKNTFDKMNIFNLDMYDKIVYLDSDMYINNNIDELFQYPHMTGVIAGNGIVPEWDGLNSGMMVIEPKRGLSEDILKKARNHNFNKDIGDQDLIEYYYDWKHKNLSISENYNMFADYIDYYINYLNYNPNEIKIIHFIGAVKPWMLSKEDLEEMKQNKKEKEETYSLYFLENYLEVLQEAK